MCCVYVVLRRRAGAKLRCVPSWLTQESGLKVVGFLEFREKLNVEGWIEWGETRESSIAHCRLFFFNQHFHSIGQSCGSVRDVYLICTYYMYTVNIHTFHVVCFIGEVCVFLG